jgi:hypothetical protein
VYQVIRELPDSLITGILTTGMPIYDSSHEDMNLRGYEVELPFLSSQLLIFFMNATYLESVHKLRVSKKVVIPAPY